MWLDKPKQDRYIYICMHLYIYIYIYMYIYIHRKKKTSKIDYYGIVRKKIE
jgi:hypothetical protein